MAGENTNIAADNARLQSQLAASSAPSAPDAKPTDIGDLLVQALTNFFTKIAGKVTNIKLESIGSTSLFANANIEAAAPVKGNNPINGGRFLGLVSDVSSNAGKFLVEGLQVASIKDVSSGGPSVEAASQGHNFHELGVAPSATFAMADHSPAVNVAPNISLGNNSGSQYLG